MTQGTVGKSYAQGDRSFLDDLERNKAGSFGWTDEAGNLVSV